MITERNKQKRQSQMTLPLFFIVLMATFLTFFHPTFYPVFLPPLFQVFPEAESVVVVEPEVFALVFAVAELSPEVVVLAAEPEVVSVAEFWVAEPEAVVSAEPEVVSVAEFVDVAEPQVSGDIAVAFVVLVPVSVVVVEVDSSGRPKFFAFPNICSFP